MGHAGAAVPRLQKLMTEAAKATTPMPKATNLKDEDRTASAQLYWMMFMICKGSPLNIVLLAGDSEGLEASRQLTEKYEPKMRTSLAGACCSHFKATRPNASRLGNGRLPLARGTVARSWTTKSRLERFCSNGPIQLKNQFDNAC